MKIHYDIYKDQSIVSFYYKTPSGDMVEWICFTMLESGEKEYFYFSYEMYPWEMRSV